MIGLPNLKPTLWCADLGVSFITIDAISYVCTKHIEIDIYFIRDLVAKKALFIHYIFVSAQITTIMTKALIVIF